MFGVPPQDLWIQSHEEALGHQRDAEGGDKGWISSAGYTRKVSGR
jgi:hypothetical protein